MRDFASYSRLVKCEPSFAGKSLGSGGNKIGNAGNQAGALRSAATALSRYSHRLEGGRTTDVSLLDTRGPDKCRAASSTYEGRILASCGGPRSEDRLGLLGNLDRHE